MVYVFGGSLVKDGIVTNDLFWISIDRMEWKVQTTYGEKPSPRYNHTCISNSEHNTLVVFGGKSEVILRTSMDVILTLCRLVDASMIFTRWIWPT